ncbi:MFS transporter [Novosphingobium resinovorum]|uniref:MFS transporter n=1 Tax=Novosphingobium resinovorum TaxID=158500 RepID=UPI002ED616CA
MRRELHLSDTQLGLLTGLMSALFYMVCGIPVAALADRTNRATALYDLATGFVTLAAAGIGVGVLEAGGSAPSYSIIADYFPPKRRCVGSAIYSLGAIVGASSGGWIAAHYDWRAVFLALGGRRHDFGAVDPARRARADARPHGPVFGRPVPRAWTHRRRRCGRLSGIFSCGRRWCCRRG